MSLWRIFQYVHKWRAGPSAVLPLSFLYALAVGFSELPALYYMHAIHCSAFLERSNLVWAQVFPPPVDVCRSPEVEQATATSNALYLIIITTLSVFASGLYGRLSDMSGRKRAMATGAVLNSLGDLWLYVCSECRNCRMVKCLLYFWSCFISTESLPPHRALHSLIRGPERPRRRVLRDLCHAFGFHR